MTTSIQLERGIATSRPIEVYEFVGRDSLLRYSSSEDEIEIAGKIYRPCRGLGRGAIERSPDSRLRLTNVMLPASDPLVSLFIPKPPPYSVSVKILRAQRDDPDLVPQTRFVGSVKSVNLDNNGHRATLGCVSSDVFMTRVLPRFTYQSVCGHRLYDARCGATTFDHQLVATCTAAVELPSGLTITVPGISASGKNFTGGTAGIQGAGDPRMVIQQGSLLTGDEDDLVILGPFNANPVGQTVELFEGCDHLLNGDCTNKFDRGISFGGFQWVPQKDIFAKGLY